MDPTDPDYLLKIPEVAAELRVSAETVRTVIARGRLPYVAVGGGESRLIKRVRRADLDAFKRAAVRSTADEEFAAAKAMVAPTRSVRRYV